jgi:phospholipase C
VEGQLFLKAIYDALVSNTELWSRTLLIITYDEHGGFYDHVIPPLAEGLFQTPTVLARGGMGTAVSSMEIRYGVRVPTFVVSPWVPAGKGPDVVLDHCSILKTIIARFLGTRRHRMHEVYYTYPFLSDRVNASRSFDAYLSATEPRLDAPASPPMAEIDSELPPLRRAIITPVLSRAQMRRGNVNFHDLTGRLARQLGR